jgi:uncharacterized protein
MTAHTAQHWISTLGLNPHPEGGFFKEIYRAEGVIVQPLLPLRYSGARVYATTIYYLLESNNFSSLHRLRSDEQWIHIDGGALTIRSIDNDGTYEQQHIGKNLDAGENPFALVTHGKWFGATVDTPNSFCLVGCFVAPGFDFEDFELAKRAELIHQFPQHAELITKLTRQ